MATIDSLREERLKKLKKLRDLGIDPYPAKSQKNYPNSEVTSNFDKFEGKTVTLTGRIISSRTHGKLAFMDIKDASGKIQLFIKEDRLEKRDLKKQSLGFDDLDLLDLGDFIQVSGVVTKTVRGEISIEAESIRILVKALRPLPERWDGLKDKETKLRRRYVDLAVNDDVFQRFLRRAKFWEAHRDFFRQNGFAEINVPVLEHVPGGGDATPFITHMESIDEDFYLRISQELYLKRLIGGGYEKVFEIGPRFRNEGLSDEHLPEHMAMEFYWAYADWTQGMEFVKELFNYVINQVYNDKKVFEIRGFKIDFSKGWEVIDFGQIFKEKYGVDVYHITKEQVEQLLKDHKIERDFQLNIPRGVDALWKRLRKDIAGPAFLINHPKFLSPLQKPSLEDPSKVERFQPIIAGSELGNGWSEVNDPVDQFDRLSEQQKLREAGDTEAQWLDIDYVEMLEYGMAPTFGYGHSERVFWFLEDVPAREGVPFPQLKRQISDQTKKIYNLSDSNLKDNAGQDFNQKMVVVLDGGLKSWELTNTVGHITAYLGNKMKSQFDTGDSFVTVDGMRLPQNSQYAVITLTADQKKLHQLITAAQDNGLLHIGYVPEMIEFLDDKKLASALSKKKSENIEYLGVGVFGPSKQLDELTKGLKLYK